ncbi:MAG TPA: hypothetical protein VMV19_15090 [Xanthobacteraceae bacterium]|nr:hypothetical protein [Xanthobacteraceae bacterium]
MRRTKILPAILAMVPATVFLTAQASLSEPAAQECKTSPGSATPKGGHWYYRIKGAGKQRCWYLSLVELQTRRADQPQTSVSTDDANSVAVNPAALSAPPALSAQPVLSAPPVLSASPAETIPEIDFAARWPGKLPAVEDASFVEPSPVSSYTDPQPATDTPTQPPLRWPLAETTGAGTASIAEIALDKISLAGLMTTAGLLLAGWAAKFVRRRPARPRPSHERPYRQPAVERPARSVPRRVGRVAGADATRLRVPA